MVISWHRLFGLILTDFFTNSNYIVELEKELSLKQQYLDVVIIKQTTGEPLTEQLPAGLEDLLEHNLITYKSLHESLDNWAIEELIGHYVNYRKQMSLSLDGLVSEDLFRLYAVTTRYPSKLFSSIGVKFEEIQQGVFELTWGTRQIRIIVLSVMPQTPKNAVWQLFSGKAQGFVYGDMHYAWHSDYDKAAFRQLYQLYQITGIAMPYTVEDFKRDYAKEYIDHYLRILPPEVVLSKYSPEERIKDLSPEERIKDLSPEERIKDLSAKELLDSLVNKPDLPPEIRQLLFEQLKGQK